MLINKKLLIFVVAAIGVMIAIIIGLTLYSQKPKTLEITFESQVQNIKIEKNNINLFLKFFPAWRLEDKPFTASGQQIKIKDIKRLHIVLTPIKQSEDIFYFDKKTNAMFQSSGQTYGDKTLTIHIYLDNELLLKKNTEKDLASRLMLGVLLRLYNLAYPGNHDMNVFVRQIRDVLQKENIETIIHVTKI